MNRFTVRLCLSGALAAIALSAVRNAAAQNVNFSTVNLATVSSGAGQNFAFATGTVNVRLVSGQVSSLQAGSSPDPNGFYALQSSSDLTPAVFRFTFDKLTQFDINQNETLTNLEVNEFTLPSSSWTILSSSNVNTSGTSSDVIFQGSSSSTPGTYAIRGTSQSFDFRIANSPGLSLYGSAISLNATAAVVPEANTAALFGLALPLVALCNRIGAIAVVRRKKQ